MLTMLSLCLHHTDIYKDVSVLQCYYVQMYVNALIKRAGIFAGQQNMDKCKTCLEKAFAICPDSIDILVHRARVSYPYILRITDNTYRLQNVAECMYRTSYTYTWTRSLYFVNIW